MEPLNFKLQIDMFTTNTDEWGNVDSFWCVINEGFFRSSQTGDCIKWNDDRYFHIGKVERNRFNSFDVLILNSTSYRTEDEALKELLNY